MPAGAKHMSKSGCCKHQDNDETVEKLKAVAHDAGREARHLLDTAGEKMPELASALEKNIREKPVQASLAALGIGFLAGLILRRR